MVLKLDLSDLFFPNKVSAQAWAMEWGKKSSKALIEGPKETTKCSFLAALHRANLQSYELGPASFPSGFAQLWCDALFHCLLGKDLDSFRGFSKGRPHHKIQQYFLGPRTLIPRTLGTRDFGTQELWKPETLGPRDIGTQGRWDSGTLGSRDFGTQGLWGPRLGSLSPKDQRCKGSQVPPKSLVLKVLGSRTQTLGYNKLEAFGTKKPYPTLL